MLCLSCGLPIKTENLEQRRFWDFQVKLLVEGCQVDLTSQGKEMLEIGNCIPEK